VLIDLDRHAVVEASAGTGKTYTLEQLVLRLLDERQVPLDQILLVTYTEKATGELKERLRAALEKKLASGTGPAAAWQAALNSFERASIHTIHGFCQRVLQEYAFENGQDFRAELVHDRDLLDSCLREIQRKHWRQEFGERLPLILELAGFTHKSGGENWEDKVRQLVSRYRPACGHRLRPEPRADWLAALHRLEDDLRQLRRRIAGTDTLPAVE